MMRIHPAPPAAAILCALVLSAWTGPARAAIPQVISYQGVLTDNAGNLVSDGNYQMTFRLYLNATGGTAFFTETRSVPVSRGGFSVDLGAVTPLGGVAFDGAYFLGTTIAGNPELVPRVALASSPYALNSARLQLPFSASATSGAGLISLTNLGSAPALSGQSNGSAVNTYAIRGLLGGLSGNGSAGVRGEGNTSNFNTVGVWGAHATGGTGVLGQSSFGVGVSGTTAGNGGVGVFGHSSAAGGSAVRAVNTTGTGPALEIQQGAIQVTGAGVNTSTPVFLHQVTAANRVFNHISYIDNPLCNGISGAILFAQAIRTGSTTAEYREPLLIQWQVSGAPLNRWALIGTPGTTIPIGAHFAILVVRP